MTGDLGDGSTLEVLQGMVAAIHEHSKETSSLTEALVSDQRQARQEADRRFNKQARKLRVLTAGLVAVIVLGLVGALQNRQVIDEQRIESSRRDERSQVAEAQRRCSAQLQNGVLARLSTLAISTQNRVAGTSAVDPGAMARLREDVAVSAAQTTPDPDLLARIRDEVSAILATVQPDSPDSRRLREDVAKANDALLRVSELCFTDTPSTDPLSGK